MRRLRLLGVLGLPLAAGLLLFHGALLIERIESAELTSPLVALRWLSVPLVLGALLWLRRQRISLLRSRPAIVLWLLVAILHLGMIAGDGRSPLLAEPLELLVLATLVVQFLLPPHDRQQRLRLIRRRAQQCAATTAEIIGSFQRLFPRAPPV